MSVPKLNTLEKGIYHCSLGYVEDEPEQVRSVFKLQDLAVENNGKPTVPYNMEQIWEVINNICQEHVENVGPYERISFKETLKAIAYNVWSIKPDNRLYIEDRVANDLWSFKADGYVFIGHLNVKFNGYNHHTQTEYVKEKSFTCDWAVPIEIFDELTANLPDHKELEKELPELPF